ncbi:MAG TPA: lamin tail domain-containing protein, partial [Candidatus Saccharibacteria bacterium]|nr:lamin tail domain-containing protein [Candidatus Saccharibacteria bacterium]
MEIRKKILVYMNYQRIKLTTMFKTNLLLSVALCLVLGLLHTPLVSNEALAQESTDKVLINEIQLDGASAYEEFIEIGSTSSSPISINGWRIEVTKLSNNLEETNICTGSARF